MTTPSGDIVYLRGLRFELCIGPDAWGRVGKPQPVVLSLQIEPEEGLEAAASRDDVSRTLDYGKLYKSLTSKLVEADYVNCEHLFASVLESIPSAKSLQLQLHLPKAALQLNGGLLYTLNSPTRVPPAETRLYDFVQTFSQISCACILGVNAHERLQKQVVEFDIATKQAGVPLSPETKPEYHNLVRTVVQRVEGSSFQTVEALASAIAQTVTMDCGWSEVTVRVEKPNAIATIETAGVQIRRRRSFFENRDFWKTKS